MQTYLNLGRNSGVRRYQIEDDFIIIEFADGQKYKYSYSKATKIHVDRMKVLAHDGRGLGSYINDFVKDRYNQKFL